VSKVKLALLSSALLVCLIASAARTTSAQATARPSPAPTPADIHATASEASVDASVPDDPAVDKMLTAYTPKVRALDEVIGKLKGDLKKGGVGSGSMGNFVADGIRAESSRKLGKPIVLAVTNGGGLRKNAIAEGDLRVRDIFELLPFENALVAFDLTGAQIVDLLRVVMAKRDAQSGARVTYKLITNKPTELEKARLWINGAEQDIDLAATYTVISIDYLLNVTGGDYAAVLKQAKNTRPLGVTIRDAITDHVKAETAAGREIKSTQDDRYVLDKAGSSPQEGQQP
jgi:2',3'-cyclic-nucleotide 2'-phosphodiesterase (5'-nucleotidase family)